ncbi:MAG: type II toxin-antitoxin system YoeB family toxin [Puniceicoccales bacterium]|jgi:toxin YoeB|nr:type II toxin-antitoxin system YoeB family toxin [Puniceicoccales bacterium]
MKLKTESLYDDGLEKLLLRIPYALNRLDRLTAEILKSPRLGIGQPHQLHGYRPRVVWSRRIVGKHRLIYEIKEDCIIFLSCYGHYEDH